MYSNRTGIRVGTSNKNKVEKGVFKNMKRQLSEQKVLKKLGIEDFRHMTKDKVMVMASLLDKMDPEVAKKALEQFPDFSTTMKEVFLEFKDTLNKAMQENSSSVKSYYETCDALISSCQKELESQELSYEQRREILDTMIVVANMKGEKDSENKKFIFQICALSVTAIGITATALLTALGGNTKVNLDSLDKAS